MLLYDCQNSSVRNYALWEPKVTVITGHKKLLWLFCCYSDYDMAEYILSQQGEVDHIMEDGTTALTVTLAKRDSKMLQLLLNKIWNKDYQQLAMDAFLELQRYGTKSDEEMKSALLTALSQRNIAQPEVVTLSEADAL